MHLSLCELSFFVISVGFLPNSLFCLLFLCALPHSATLCLTRAISEENGQEPFFQTPPPAHPPAARIEEEEEEDEMVSKDL